MNFAPEIPFGYKRVPAPVETQRGDGIWNGMKFERVRRFKRQWPTISEPGAIVIRRCAIEQPELFANVHAAENHS